VCCAINETDDGERIRGQKQNLSEKGDLKRPVAICVTSERIL
jgi:hypothetical protein